MPGLIWSGPLAVATARSSTALCCTMDKFTDAERAGLVGVTHAYGINDAGDVVGEYVDAHGRPRGFFLEDGRYTTLNVPGMRTQTIASQINNAGRDRRPFLGWDDINHGFLSLDGVYTTFNDPLATGGT